MHHSDPQPRLHGTLLYLYFAKCSSAAVVEGRKRLSSKRAHFDHEGHHLPSLAGSRLSEASIGQTVHCDTVSRSCRTQHTPWIQLRASASRSHHCER